MKTRCLALLAICGLLASCLDQGDPLIRLPNKPASCGNGTCEIADEDCQICPEDCSCCNAASSEGSSGIDDANLALDRLIERTSDPALRERLRSLR